MRMTSEQFAALMEYIDARIVEKTTEGDTLIEGIRASQLRDDLRALLVQDGA